MPIGVLGIAINVYLVIMAVLVVWFAVLLILETKDYREQKRIEREMRDKGEE